MNNKKNNPFFHRKQYKKHTKKEKEINSFLSSSMFQFEF